MRGEGPDIAHGARNLGGQQTAFDAEVTAIEQVVKWFLSQGRNLNYRHMIVHLDSTSAIARASHTGAGPGQTTARNVRNMVCELRGQGKTVDLVWVKGHQGTPGNEKADVLAGKAASKTGYSKVMTISHLKPRISERYNTKKEDWQTSPHHHGTEEIPPPPPKKSCLDRMRNALARTVAQTRTGHWGSAVYLKRIRKMSDDKCWFYQSSARMIRSHVLLHCPNAKLRAARREAWEGKDPGGVRVLLANPRWERRLVKFLELSEVGRVMADEDGAYAARVGAMGGGRRSSPQGRGLILFYSTPKGDDFLLRCTFALAFALVLPVLYLSFPTTLL
jgi:ribonuclease HI